MRDIRVSVDGVTTIYNLKTATQFGEDCVLVDPQTDILRNADWFEKGYVVAPFLSDEEGIQIRRGICALVEQAMKAAGINVPENFEPTEYHNVVSSDALHQKVIEFTREVPIESWPSPAEIVEKRFSELCRADLSLHNPALARDFFIIRIVRPRSNDNNPPHKDGYLPIWERCVNTYIPIAGSDKLSSLAVVPGSHLWNESEIERTESGAVINDRKYHVPAITAWKSPTEMTRIDPKLNEVLIFSPFLIHGQGNNLNLTRTRISVELRLTPRHP